MRPSFFPGACVTTLLLALTTPANADKLSPWLRSHAASRASQDVAVSVRLKHAPSAAAIQRMTALGAQPVRIRGTRLAAVGRVLSVRVPSSRLPALAALPEVERIEPAVPQFRIRPLNETALLVGAPFVWNQPAVDGVTGEGVLVADHEGGFDPFHPDFFRPDGGVYAFEDSTGDQKAGPGDHVDLDGDGVFESELRLLEGKRSNIYAGEEDVAEPGYQPDVDWLYVDQNQDIRRNFGAAEGFSDQDPAMGEPIFVGDDVDRDGAISGGERLVRLKTSKVKVGYIDGTVYRRGNNLSSHPVEDASHGAGATGIVAMGWPELRRYTGVAPGVDLALINSTDIVSGIAFSQSEGADVDLYELNLPGDASDGSSNVEVAISEAAAAGTVQLAAAGNLAGVDKVMRVTLSPNLPTTVELTTDDYDYYSYEYTLAQMTWHGDVDDVEVAVIGSQGTRFEVNPSFLGTVDGFTVQAYWEQTSKGNGWVTLYILPESGSTLPEDTLGVELRSTSSILVQGLLFDSASGWGKGVSWTSNVTDDGTALSPSTADDVISVAAYGGRQDLDIYGWGGIGERRLYSGKGPRIDGSPVVDISAPDDPFTASPSSHGAYQCFGGTSGALPHVAGVAALLRQHQPMMSHEGVEAALKTSAKKDTFTGANPGEAYGHGKVRIDKAILGQETPSGATPTLSLQAVGEDGQDLTLRAVVDDPDGHGDQVLVAWDVGYDRQYEIAASLDREITVTAEDGLPVVAKAVDPTGRSSRALLVLSSGSDAGVEPQPEAGVPDGGVDGSLEDTGGDGTAGGGGNGGTPPPSAPSGSEDDGCGCRTAGGNPRGAWIALLILGALFRRRPRRFTQAAS